MKTYKHTSIGWIPISAIVFTIIGVFFISYINEDNSPSIFILISLVIGAFCSLWFPVLTIIGNKEGLRVYYFPGLVSKKFLFKNIKSFSKIKKRYTQCELQYKGQLFKGSAFGKYLFYMSGLEGIELTMKNGKKYQIATNEPEELIEFMREKSEAIFTRNNF